MTRREQRLEERIEELEKIIDDLIDATGVNVTKTRRSRIELPDSEQ